MVSESADQEFSFDLFDGSIDDLCSSYKKLGRLFVVLF